MIISTVNKTFIYYKCDSCNMNNSCIPYCQDPGAWHMNVDEAMQIEEYRNVIIRAVEYFNAINSKYPDLPEVYTFERHHVGADWRVLHRMVADNILRVIHKSNKHTVYEFVEPLKSIRDAINQYKEYERVKNTDITTQGQDTGATIEINSELFDDVAGYDDVKQLFVMALKAPKPVHILLIGPPATAKTLFLLAVERLPASRYVLGGMSTKVGLAEQLVQYKPHYLLIDELDKMRHDDYTVLLSLCETGRVVVSKHNTSTDVTLDTRVFAACNEVDRIPREVRSRFAQVTLHEYDDNEFIEVATHLLVRREGANEDLAQYIANAVVHISKDIRDVVRIGRLCKTKSDVDLITKILSKYNNDTEVMS